MATIFEKLQALVDPTVQTDEAVRAIGLDGEVDESERVHNRTLYFLDDGTCLVVWDRGFAEHLQNNEDTLEETVIATWQCQNGRWIKES